MQVLGIRVASGVETEFPYRVRIASRGLIATTLFADTVSDPQGYGLVGLFVGDLSGMGSLSELVWSVAYRLFLFSAAAFWGFSRGGFPENA